MATLDDVRYVKMGDRVERKAKVLAPQGAQAEPVALHELDEPVARHVDDEDTGKSDGANLLAGDELEEYRLDHAQIGDDVREELEHGKQRGSGFEANVDVPESDKWHDERADTLADHETTRAQAEGSRQGMAQAQAKRVIGAQARHVIEVKKRLEGVAIAAAVTRSLADDELVGELEQVLENPSQQDAYDKLLGQAEKANEHARQMER